MVINGYEVTYLSDTMIGNRRDYSIQYRELDKDGKLTGDSFVLKPYALYNNDFSKLASMNPDTRHYLTHDVFTHITGLPPSAQSAEEAKVFEDSLKFRSVALSLGDTAHLKKHAVKLLEFVDQPRHPEYQPEPGDIALGAKVEVSRLDFDTAQIAYPVVVLRQNLVYHYPDQVNAFSVRVKLPEEALTARLGSEDDLNYQKLSLKPGESVDLGDVNLLFEKFEPNASHPMYKPEEGDVAVNALLKVIPKNEESESSSLKPLFFIRNSAPQSIKDVDAKFGVHARLSFIDPANGSAELLVAQGVTGGEVAIPIEIAENSSRTDWIVLEATVFPGINLFWLGSILMLLGLLIAMGYRIIERRKMKTGTVPGKGGTKEAVHREIESLA